MEAYDEEIHVDPEITLTLIVYNCDQILAPEFEKMPDSNSATAWSSVEDILSIFEGKACIWLVFNT